MATNISSRKRSQYQHFIPRFILRNFRNENQPPTGPSSTGKGGRSKSGKDGIINLLDLQTATVLEKPLSTQLGMVDIYVLPGQSRLNEIESKLAELERKASMIIFNANQAFAGAQPTLLTLSRTERNDLRRFLFIMKYRNRGFHSRYNCDSIDDYTADDKDKMREFMSQRGLNSPREVWTLNLRLFLDYPMDAGKKWTKDITALAYGDDATLFKLHAESSYLAFCKPEALTDEYLLTENAYGVFEGPNGLHIDIPNGCATFGVYTEWHNFAPVSPRLLILLRSNYLPCKTSDAGEPVRQQIYKALRDMHHDPNRADSILQDLPVDKCRTSYSVITNGRIYGRENFASWSDQDKFYFRCFSISGKHVDRINSIMLEEAHITNTIVFKSPCAAVRGLRAYLEADLVGFKTVIDGPGSREPYLNVLTRLIYALGGQASPVFNRLKLPKPEIHMSRYVGTVVGGFIFSDERLETLYNRFREISLLRHPDLFPLSSAFKQNFFYDLDQVCRMVFMAIKTDVIMDRSSPPLQRKIDIKRNRLQLFMQLPVQRFWMYLKIFRNLPHFDQDDFTKQTEPLEVPGPEDDVAPCKILPQNQLPRLTMGEI